MLEVDVHAVFSVLCGVLRLLCWKGSIGRDAWSQSLQSTWNGGVSTWNVLYMHWQLRIDCAWKRSASLKYETVLHFSLRLVFCTFRVMRLNSVSAECGCRLPDS